ncbi:hypothetical protein MC885_018011 [Smutsia gigantea]|nr:hypothetical protein MC885_018011 [Smutsia gigantea]
MTVPTPTKRTSTVLWSETVDIHMRESLTAKEIRRQEVIYEMSRGEQNLIEDLKLARKKRNSHIYFGDLDAYIPLHEDLLARIGEATKPGGTVEQIGHILVNWLPGLNAYKGYCSNQLAAKALLDRKKKDPRISIIQGVLSDINLKMGESECQYYIDQLEYLNERQKDPRIEASKVLLYHGELKNKNGRKFYIFPFQDILVLTRPVTRNERHSYQVYRQPIPTQDLVLEDLQDGDVRMGGPFRGAFGNSDKAKNTFRVRFQDPSPGQSHTLQANDVFHKQQWFKRIQAAIAPFQQAITPAELQGFPELHEECVENNPSAGNVKSQKRASTASSGTQVQVDGDASACVSPAGTQTT